MRFALDHSPRIAAAKAQRQIAVAGLLPESGRLHPNLTAAASAAIQGPAVTLPLGGIRRTVVPSEDHRLWIAADQVIYHAGRGLNDDRQKALRESAEAAYAATADAVLHEAAYAYFQVLQARSGAAIAQKAVPALQTDVETVRTLISAGQAVPLDLRKAQASLMQVQHDLASAEGSVRVAEAAFNLALGRALSAPVRLSGNELVANPATSVDDAAKTALTDRADIRQRTSELKAAEAALGLARLQHGPTVTANAIYALQKPTLLRRDNLWSLGATISFPLLTTGQEASETAQAAAGVTAASAALEELRQGAIASVLRAWEDRETAFRTLTSDQESREVAAEELRAEELRQQAGDAVSSAVSEALLKLERAESLEDSDRYALSLKTLDLRLQMGSMAAVAEQN